jgi:hypothetical protein
MSYYDDGYLAGVQDWEENLSNGIFDEPDNPYCTRPSSTYSKEEWRVEWPKNRGWFSGYRDSKKKYFNDKYRIPELQSKVWALISSYGLAIKFEDEYHYAYMETPEGFESRIIEYKEEEN